MLYKTKNSKKGGTLIPVLFIVATMSSAGFFLIKSTQVKETAIVELAKKEKFDLAMKTVFKSGLNVVNDLYNNNSGSFTSKLSTNGTLLDQDSSMATLDPEFTGYTYNYYIKDNDDGDSNLATDTDGMVFFETRIQKRDGKTKSIVGLIEVIHDEDYSPNTIKHLPSAFGTCYDNSFRVFNTSVDLNNNAEHMMIYLDGKNYDMNGQLVSLNSSKNKPGLSSNGNFSTEWWESIWGSLDNISGNDNQVGEDAILEYDHQSCVKYRKVERDLITFLEGHTQSSEVLTITPEDSNVDYSDAKIIILDATGGGLLQINPTASGQPIVLGTVDHPVIIFIKGKHPRCTENVHNSLLLGFIDNCPFNNGDGTVKFNGDVQGYGAIIQESSVDFAGNVSWNGFIHSIASNLNEVLDEEDFGRVMEIRGNLNITGALFLNRPSGEATLGRLEAALEVNYNVVIGGNLSRVNYSEEGLNYVSNLYETISPHSSRIYSAYIK